MDTQKEWEKGLASTARELKRGRNRSYQMGVGELQEAIKPFISRLLTEQRQEVVEEIRAKAKLYKELKSDEGTPLVILEEDLQVISQLKK